MSFNITFVVVRDTTLDELGAVDPAPLTFDSVSRTTRDPVLAGTQVGPHVVVVDPSHGVLASTATAGLGRQVYMVVLGGVASTYVIQADGPVTRLLVHQDSEIVEDEGAPLPAESALGQEEFLEDAHLAVLASVMEAPFSTVWEAPFFAVHSS